MPESLRKSAPARTRWVGLLAWALAAAAVTPFAWADPVPASIRACTAETDPSRRLACYDRELARFPEQSLPPTAPRRGPLTTSGADEGSRQGDEQKATKQDSAENEPRHLSARVLSTEGTPDELVLHLDNGQTWEQVQAATTDLNLRAGDVVKIDKQFGAYWLSARYGGAMKVRQKQ